MLVVALDRSMKTVTKSDFQQEVVDSKETVLVDFFATWCQPCNMMVPALERVAKKGKVVKVNVDESPTLAALYKIEAMPTLLVFKDGKEVNRLVGLQSEQRMLQALSQ